MFKPSDGIYEFGPFRLDVKEKLLTKGGEPVSLTPKMFETLAVLVERSGHLVARDELLKEVWPDSFVEEGGLTQNIYLLRKILGDEGGQRYIETVPRHGYRFVAGVKRLPGSPPGFVLRERTRAGIVIEEEDGGGEGGLSLPGWLGHVHPARATARPGGGRRAAAARVAVLVLAGVAALSAWKLWAGGSRPAGAPPRTVAVLPFRVISDSGGDEHMGLGMTDATITRLSSLKRVAVKPTSAVYRYAGGTSDSLAAGRELGVEAVLDGTVQRAGGRVRVTVRLLRVSDGQPLWAEKFDEQFTNLFELQDVISEQLAAALRLSLSEAERDHLTKRYTRVPGAYEAYARGLYFRNKRTSEGIKRGLDYFEEAVRLDPQYALAYASIADSYGLLAYHGYEGAAGSLESYRKSEAAARKALSLDAGIAEAHASMGAVELQRGDEAAAEASLRRALALDPDSPTVRLRASTLNVARNRLDEAAAHARRAVECDPLSAIFTSNYASVLFFRGDYRGASEYSRKALEVEPEAIHALLILGLSQEQLGNYDEAIPVLEKRRRVQGDKPDLESLRSLAHAYARAGRADEARALIVQLERMAKEDGRVLTTLALVYSALGDMDRALLLIEERSAAWSRVPFVFDLDPRYAKLRSHPRFAEITKRLAAPAPRH